MFKGKRYAFALCLTVVLLCWLSICVFAERDGKSIQKLTNMDTCNHMIVQLDAKQPTCHSVGWEMYEYCLYCEYTTYVELPALGHPEGADWVLMFGEIPPKCNTPGKRAGWICINDGCDAKGGLEEIPAYGAHAFDPLVFEVVQERTCTEDGILRFTCMRGSDCDHTEGWRYEDTPEGYRAAGHTEETIPGIAATCLQDGVSEEKYCIVCSEITVPAQTIKAPGHAVEIIQGLKATCANFGLTDGERCTACGLIMKYQETIDPLKHEYGAPVIHEATCTENGSAVFTCIREGCNESEIYYDEDGNEFYHSYTEIINAVGHSAGEPASCAAAQSCVKCGCVLEAALKHDYILESFTEPNCTKSGSKTFVCQRENCKDDDVYIDEEGREYGHRYTEIIEPTDHTPGDAATCSSDQTCVNCDYVFQAALNHTPGDEATCITDQTCIRCDYVFVHALNHPVNQHAIYEAVAPTCAKNGFEKSMYCRECGFLIVENNGEYVITDQRNVVPAIGHKYKGFITTLPSCDDSGIMTYICERDGCTENDIYVDGNGKEYYHSYTEEIAATGHSYEGVVTAPTCENKGFTTYSCVNPNCGSEYVGDYVNASGHVEVTDAYKAPTCLMPGLTEGKHCAVKGCNKVIVAQTEIAATGHEFNDGEVLVQPSCSQTGLIEFTCIHAWCDYEDVDGNKRPYSYTGILEKLAHDEIVHEAEEPTCTKEGWNQYVTCSKCDYSTLADNKRDKLQHKYESSVVPPKCTVDGYTMHVCSECGDSYKDMIVYAEGHKEVELPEVKPTCNADGLTKGVICSECDLVKVEQSVIPKLGHDDGEWIVVKNATSDTEGVRQKQCTRCSFVLETGTIPKLEDRIPGDVNDDGVVNLYDLLRLAKHVGGYQVEINFSNATVNGDDVVNLFDLLRLAKYVGGYSVVLE